MATPGLRLIQDLLAKSVAKWSGDTTDLNDESKRKRSDHSNEVYRKKTKIKNKQCKTFTETVVKTEDEKYKNVKIETNNIKVEYTETKPVFPDAKIEARTVKREYPEFDIAKSQIKTQTNDGLKRKQFDAEKENCMKKRKKKKPELNDKDNRSEKEITRIKNEYESENKETNHMFLNTEKEVIKGKIMEKTAEDKSLIMLLLKKSVAKYTENRHDLQNFKKEKVEKDGKFEKIEKKKITSSYMPFKTEDNEVEMKKEYTEFNTKTVPDGKSYIMRLVKQSVADHTENHDWRSVKDENIDKKDEKVRKKKVVRAKQIRLKEENVENDSNQSKAKKSKTYKQVKAFSPDKDEILLNAMDTFGENISILNLSRDPHRTIRKQKTTFKQVAFSLEEDEIITTAMDTFGDNISIGNLGRELHRSWASIQWRVNKLKTGKMRKERKKFSLTEDLVIMDIVLESLSGKTLHEISLQQNYGINLEVATALGRNEVSTMNRWGNQLRPWILQHYSGTLNLDIRRMLANYLADTFDSIDSIDWLSVAKKPEFVGHTLESLRRIFYAYLFQSTKFHQKPESTEITLNSIADNANVAYGEKNCRKVSGNVLIRQKQVIDYFEQYVKKHGITNFL